MPVTKVTTPLKDSASPAALALGDAETKQAPQEVPKQPPKFTWSANDEHPGVPKEHFTRPEAMQYLRVRRHTFVKFERDHKLPKFYIGSKPLYRRADLDALVAKLVEKAQAGNSEAA